MMTNRQRVKALIANAALFATLACFAASKPQPNIVHILTDDLGWMDVACNYRAVHGKESIYETPNIDRIAKNGMRFMQAYSPSPTCAPSRAAYMAGQSTLKTGVLHVLGGWPARPRTPTFQYIDPVYTGRLSLETPTIATLLKQAGYTTGHIQKFHFGGASRGFPGPLDYGFDFGWTTGPNMRYNDPELWDPTDKKRADYQGIWAPLHPHRLANFPSSHDPNAPYSLDKDDRPYDSVVDLAVRWMTKVYDDGQPFFLNFCPSFVHGPISTRDRKRLAYYCDKMGIPFPTDPGPVTDKKVGQVNPYYAAMIDSLDWQVGQILSFLETTEDPRNPGHKLSDNTYLMVSSDNGGAKGGSEAVADNAPLREGKKSVFEGGVRIPFLIQGPGIQADSVNHTPINLIDMLPTYMAMAGKPLPTTLDLDGCNVLPVMLGQEDQAHFSDGTVRDTMCYSFPIEQFAHSVIRKGGWKLLLNHVPEMNGHPEVQLYQLYKPDGSVADRSEQYNLAAAHPELVAQLRQELETWLKQNNAILPYKNAHLPSQKLPGSERVPGVTSTSSHEDALHIRVETGPDKAKLVEALLLYTTNGCADVRDGRHYEEWFIAPATLRPDGADALAPPGTTHSIFYLRDENGFLVTSEPLAARIRPGSDIWAKGSEFIDNVYGYRPGLIALLKTGRSALVNARKASLQAPELAAAIARAEAIAKLPEQEGPYMVAMRNLRYEIKELNVPQAKRFELNQFRSKKWASRERDKISARGANAPLEGAKHAFDGNPRTKWLDFAPQGSWIQYDFAMPTTIASYTITSAGDAPERDPKDWQLLGSNDRQTWIPLDTRAGELWAKRQQPRTFEVANIAPYMLYRLAISAVRDAKSANSVQIAEIAFAHPSQRQTKAAPLPPNILLILSDDHAKKALSCYGNTDIKTPALDRLAAEGMRFEHALTPNSFCTPARAAVLTGKYSHKNGVTHLNQSFDGSQQTFPKLLQSAGYQTALVGKWHLLSRPTGFDYYCVMKMQGMPVDPLVFEPQHQWIPWSPKDRKSYNKGGRKLKGYNNDVMTDVAIDWLKNRDPTKPFCLLLHPKPPHAPYHPPKTYEDFLQDVTIPEPATLLDDHKGRTPELIRNKMSANRLVLGPTFQKQRKQLEKENPNITEAELTRAIYQEYIKGYYRLVKSVDDNVGRVLDHLDENSLTKNTLVIYTADQGFSLGEHGFYNKQWMYEEPLHQPLLVRLPGTIEAGTVHKSMVNHVDLAPTLLEFAGLPTPQDMQGHSLKPILEGKAEKVRDASYYHFYSHGKRLPEMIGVRTATHKLIHYPEMPKSHQWELFDLQQDPDEINNLYHSPEKGALRKHLRERLRTLIRDLDDPVEAPALRHNKEGV